MWSKVVAFKCSNNFYLQFVHRHYAFKVGFAKFAIWCALPFSLQVKEPAILALHNKVKLNSCDVLHMGTPPKPRIGTCSDQLSTAPTWGGGGTSVPTLVSIPKQ